MPKRSGSGDEEVALPLRGPPGVAGADASAEDRAPRYFCTAMLIVAAGALVAYVAAFSRNVPYFEDWLFVPVLAGTRPFTLSWLVETTVAEHRFVLAKALLYPLWRVSGADLRGAMWFDAALLVAASFACIAAARAVRGRAAFADAFFPLALLTLGHCENLLFFAQVFFVVPVVIMTAMLVVIATDRWAGRLSLVLALCAGLVLLPACGGIGMLQAPVLAAWFVFAARTRARAGDTSGRRDARLLFAAVGLCALGAALYFVGWTPRPPAAGAPASWADVGRTLAQVWSLALGGGGRVAWPVLGPMIAAAVACAIAALVVAAVRGGAGRRRATGIAACLFATAALAAGIGVGRAAVGPGAGLPARYALLMAPALLGVYFAAIAEGGPLVRRIVPVFLFTAACALVGPNVELGLAYGRARADLADALQADLERGVPPPALAQWYAGRVFPDGTVLEAGLAALEAARRGPYAKTPPRAAATAFHETDVPVTLVGMHEAALAGDTIVGEGPDPYVVLTLTRRAAVAGVRVRFVLEADHPGPAQLEAYWMLSGHTSFEAARGNGRVAVTAGPMPQTVTFWIHETVDHLRLDPDTGHSRFRLLGITLLTREALP